jgi:hypothetical protein
VEKKLMVILAIFRVPAIDTYQIDRMKLNFGVNGAMTMCSNTVLLDLFSLFHNFQDATGDAFNIINNIMGAAMSIAGGLIPSPDPPEGRQREGFNLVSLMVALEIEKKKESFTSIISEMISIRS